MHLCVKVTFVFPCWFQRKEKSKQSWRQEAQVHSFTETNNFVYMMGLELPTLHWCCHFC